MSSRKRTTGRHEKKKIRRNAVVLDVIITIIIIIVITVRRRSPEGTGLVVLVTALFATNTTLHLKISFIMCIVWNIS